MMTSFGSKGSQQQRFDYFKITPVDLTTSLTSSVSAINRHYELLLMSKHQPSQSLDLRNLLFNRPRTTKTSTRVSSTNRESTEMCDTEASGDSFLTDSINFEQESLTSRLCQYFSLAMSVGFSAVSSLTGYGNEDVLPMKSLASSSNTGDVCNKIAFSKKVKQAIDKAVAEDLKHLLSTYDGKGNEIDEDEFRQLRQLRHSLIDHHRQRAVSMIQEIRAYLSPSMCKVAGWVTFKMLSKIFTSIQFSKRQMDTLRKLQKSSKKPFLFLPVHRSHMDYILISFILYMNGIRVPLGAAGDNMKIPFFDTILRGLGAFFIRRKMDSIPIKKDYVYRAVLEEYIVENLKAGESISMFIEGGRSRSGKELVPRSGLLSFVVNAISEGRLDDVYLVPVGIGYEKLVDGNFVTEQLGRPKTPESFLGAVTAIWQSLRSNFGSVRVDFSQPFSLKDYLRTVTNDHRTLSSLNHYNKNQTPSKCVLHSNIHLPPSAPTLFCPVGIRTSSSDASLSSLIQSCPNTQSYSPLYGDSANNNHMHSWTQDKRVIVQKLAEHLIMNSYQSSSLMCTQMLAFILLTSYRKGVTLRQLIPAMNWLREELVVNKKLFIGYAGETVDVIKYACAILGRDLVSTEVIQMAWTSRESLDTLPIDSGNRSKKIVLIKPATKVPSVIELQFYANGVATHFALESIVVNALYSLFEWGLETFDDIEGNNNSISRKNLVDASLALCRILKYEFILSPPCTSAESDVNKIIDNFVTKGILRTKQPPRTKFSLDIVEEEDENGIENTFRDEWLSVSITADNVDLLRMYRNVVGPLIESYWLGAKQLVSLVGKSQAYDAFVGSLVDAAKEQLRQGLLCFQESIAAESLKHSIEYFIDSKVLCRQWFNGVSVVFLSDEFDTQDCVKDVIKNIERFKK